MNEKRQVGVVKGICALIGAILTAGWLSYSYGRLIYFSLFVFHHPAGIDTIEVINCSVAFCSIVFLISMFFIHKRRITSLRLFICSISVIIINLVLAFIRDELFWNSFNGVPWG